MTERPSWVIAGASLAGGRAAETLRREGFDGRLVLVGAEPERPYERPPLSKELLRGTLDEERVFLRPATWYAENAIELRLGTRAEALDPASRTLRLAGGETLPYDHLLIATGAEARRLRVPGEELDGVLVLRTLADSRELRRRMQRASRVAVVGMGFIGGEVAACCREAGLEVVALEMLATPLQHALGPRVGALYAAIHRERGVDLRTGETVTGFSGTERVEGVTTASGMHVACDLAVVGVGAVPACAWLEGSGIELRNGIMADELCRASLPDVFAAGDVANAWHPALGRRLRVEHYDNAQNQGVAAARSMLGRGAPYAPVPSFWSDQYGLRLQHVGLCHPGDEVVLRGRPGEGSWVAFYVRDGVLRAALGVDRFREVNAARRLIASGARVAAATLADEGADLRELARSAAGSESGGAPRPRL